MKLAICFCAALTLWAGSALAADADLASTSPGYTYFNRAGADWKRHTAELSDCVEQARLTEGDQDNATGGVLPGLLDAYSEQRGKLVNIENCMVAREWRVVQVPDAEGQRLTQLAPDALAEQLAAWTGDDKPHGTIVRQWANDASNGTTQRRAPKPNWFGKPSLSLRAYGPKTLSGKGRTFSYKSDFGKRIKVVNLKDLAPPPPGAAVIIARVQGGGIRNGGFLFFSPTFTESPFNDFLAFGYATKRNGGFVAMIVPAGTWRIRSTGNIYSQLNFCLGSPQFELASGDVVYAGAFDLSAPSMAPNLSLDALRIHLAATPEIAGAIKPARYVNGSTAPCGDAYIYALDFPGVPFRNDYPWRNPAR